MKRRIGITLLIILMVSYCFFMISAVGWLIFILIIVSSAILTPIVIRLENYFFD